MPSLHVISVPSLHVIAVADIIPVRLYCAATELKPMPVLGYVAPVGAGEKMINANMNNIIFRILPLQLFPLPELGLSLPEQVALSIR